MPRAVMEARLEQWASHVERAAPRLLGDEDRTGVRLAEAVRRLSDAYTRERDAIAKTRAEDGRLAARLRFFFLRDLAKIGPPVRELAWASALPDRAELRVLDVGAGLGASSLGLAEALAGLSDGARRDLRIVAIDSDVRALNGFRDLVASLDGTALGERLPRIDLATQQGDLEQLASDHRGSGFDFVVVGFALNELGNGVAPEETIERRAALLATLGGALAPDGALIVLEPALRTVARELHRVRDRLVADPSNGVVVFAPCIHARTCPMLATERHWCHEDLPIALPGSVGRTARAAGLRREGLTYAYLTLRLDRRTLAAAARERLGPDSLWLRVVSEPLRTKGKREVWGCGEPGRVRVSELDRDAGRRGRLDDSGRGELLALDGELDPDRPRLTRNVDARRIRPGR